MCACLQAVALHISRKNILLPIYIHPCSRARLQSLASSASSFAKRHSSSPSSHTRGIFLFWSEVLLLQFIWLSLAHMKGDVFCASNHRAQGSCTLAVCVIQPCSHLSQHGLCVVLYFCSHQKRRNHRHPNMTMPPLQQYQDIHPTCR